MHHPLTSHAGIACQLRNQSTPSYRSLDFLRSPSFSTHPSRYSQGRFHLHLFSRQRPFTNTSRVVRRKHSWKIRSDQIRSCIGVSGWRAIVTAVLVYAPFLRRGSVVPRFAVICHCQSSTEKSIHLLIRLRKGLLQRDQRSIRTGPRPLTTLSHITRESARSRHCDGKVRIRTVRLKSRQATDL